MRIGLAYGERVACKASREPAVWSVTALDLRRRAKRLSDSVSGSKADTESDNEADTESGGQISLTCSAPPPGPEHRGPGPASPASPGRHRGWRERARDWACGSIPHSR